MLDLFLCHSPAGRDVANRIASRLEECADAKVWKEEITSGSNVMDAWEGGLSAAGILLVLDPHVTPRSSSRTEWGPLLDHVSESAQPPIACVRAETCGYPKLLERNNHFVWKDESLPVLRSIEQWVISLHDPGSRNAVLPVRVPRFTGRDQEMDELWRSLVDRAGSAVTIRAAEMSGKTTLAQEFGAQAAAHFRDVLWLGCSILPPAAIVAELASQLGGVTAASVPDVLAAHRLLVVLDDLRCNLPFDFRHGSRSSMLITTARNDIAAGSIMILAPASAVPPDPPADLDARRLWHAISVCCPHGVIEQLPAGLVGTSGAVEQLIATGLVDRLDPLRVRLNASSRLAAHADADIESLRRRHAEAVYAAVIRPDSVTELMAAEIHVAFQTAVETDWPLARDLGRRAANFLRGRNRLGEAVHLLKALGEAAEQRQDPETVRASQHEISWIDGGHELFRYPVQVTEQLGFSFG